MERLIENLIALKKDEGEATALRAFEDWRDSLESLAEASGGEMRIVASQLHKQLIECAAKARLIF